MSDDRYGQTTKRIYLLPDSSVPLALPVGAGGGWGAWQVLSGGLGGAVWVVGVVLALHAMGYAFTVQVGTGAAGSEVVRWEGPLVNLGGFFGVSCVAHPLLFGVPVGVGTRLVMRSRGTAPGASCYGWVQYVLD